MAPHFIGIVLGLVVIACVLTVAFFQGAKGRPKPYPVHPKVTRLDARRRLLEKARREQDWLAENARG